MRVKVLEALAAGKALVATSLALAGTTAAEDGVAVRADDPAEFVAAVSWLLHDVAARAQMGRRAARWAARELSWDGRAAAYSHLYATLVEPNGPIKPSLGSTRWSANLPASRCDAAQI